MSPIYTKGRIDTIDCPDNEHLVARNMWRIGINKYKEKNCASSWLFTKITKITKFVNVSNKSRHIYVTATITNDVQRPVTICSKTH